MLLSESKANDDFDADATEAVGEAAVVVRRRGYPPSLCWLSLACAVCRVAAKGISSSTEMVIRCPAAVNTTGLGKGYAWCFLNVISYIMHPAGMVRMLLSKL